MTRQQAGVAYDREVLVNVLVYHWPTATSGCWCGWAVLGASFPGHVADVYEASVTALAEVGRDSGSGRVATSRNDREGDHRE